MSSINYNAFLKQQDPLRTFRVRPYTWDPKQTSESEAFRDRMYQRYHFPNTNPKLPEPAYVPYILDHRIEGAKVGLDTILQPVPRTILAHLTWQVYVMQIADHIWGSFNPVCLFVRLHYFFGGMVEVILFVVTAWFVIEKLSNF